MPQVTFEKDIDQLTTRLHEVHLAEQVEYEAESLMQYELGFSRLIELIIQHKKPMVGHNCLFDVMYFYQNFIADLPDTLEEFIHNFSFYFPQLYDTKAMAETLNLFQRTDLQTMSMKCVTDKRWRNYLEFEQDLAHGFRKYAGKVALHEAGYDSYITGIAFASMVKQLEVQTFVEWTKIKARSEGVGQGHVSEEVLACRTGRDFAVPLPEARNLVELTSSKVHLSCAVEFANYMMFSMEGQRALRFEPEYWK